MNIINLKHGVDIHQESILQCYSTEELYNTKQSFLQCIEQRQLPQQSRFLLVFQCENNEILSLKPVNKSLNNNPFL